MNIGQLFVSLGVKGSDKTLGALGGVKKGMKETASMSLEAKAAILGTLYAFQRMMSESGQTGQKLTNFNATLGISAKTLQQYQYAARQVGVANEAVAGSFQGLQETITKALMGKGVPEGLARLSEVVGVTTAEFPRFAEDPAALIQKLQEYAQKEKHAGLRNMVLKSFGMGDDMVAALTRNAFNPDVLKRAPTYSDSEIKSLDRAAAAWSNLGNKVEMAFGRFNAKHGGQLVSDISQLTDKVVILAEAFMKLSKTAKLFEGLSKVFEGWGHIFNGISNSVEAINALIKGGEEGQAVKDKAAAFMSDVSNYASSEFDDFKQAGVTDKAKRVADFHPIYGNPIAKWLAGLAADQIPDDVKQALKFNMTGFGDTPQNDRQRQSMLFNMTGFAPPTTPAVPTQNISTQNVNVQQTLNFQHEGKDAKQTGDSVKQATQRALRQLSAQSQGS